MSRAGCTLTHVALTLCFLANSLMLAGLHYKPLHFFKMSLKNRRKKLSMNYVLKLKTYPDNPAYSCVFEPPNSKLFEKSRLTPPLGLRILPLFEDSKIDLDMVDDTMVSDTPPWSQSEPQICLSWTKYKNDTTNPEVCKQAFF